MTLDPVRSFLVEHLGVDLIGAFIYGSVAANRTGPASDIDCFVITKTELEGLQRQRMGTAFADLQRALGFTPDPAYPIELFSAGACRSILDDAVLQQILADAAIAGIDARVAESDEVEVLRALLDRRLVLRSSATLDSLTAQAWALAQRYPTGPDALLRALGLVNSSPVGL